MTKFAVALAFLAFNLYTYHELATNPVIPEREAFASFPLRLDEWVCDERQGMEPEIEAQLGVTDWLICNYRRPSGDLVNVYVGYHETQIREEGGGSRENSIHPPAHCLPGSGWDIIDSTTVPVRFDGMPGGGGTARRLLIAKGEARQLVYYWYQSRGRVISEDWKKVVYVGLDRATRGRTDGSLTRFTIPLFRGDEARAEAAFAELAPQVLSRLSRYVPE